MSRGHPPRRCGRRGVPWRHRPPEEDPHVRRGCRLRWRWPVAPPDWWSRRRRCRTARRPSGASPPWSPSTTPTGLRRSSGGGRRLEFDLPFCHVDFSAICKCLAFFSLLEAKTFSEVMTLLQLYIFSCIFYSWICLLRGLCIQLLSNSLVSTILQANVFLKKSLMNSI